MNDTFFGSLRIWHMFPIRRNGKNAFAEYADPKSLVFCIYLWSSTLRMAIHWTIVTHGTL